MWSSSRRLGATAAAFVRCLAPGLALVLALALACTEVHVEETRVSWNTPVCGGGNSGGGRNGGGSSSQQPQATGGDGMMDTYMVQIFELNDATVPDASECAKCIADRKNCFIEKSACVCGNATPVDSGRMQEMLKGVRVGLPTTYPSLYCMRVMALERTSSSDSVDCECDSVWEQHDQIRLCALSAPYAASSLPIKMDVQCSANTDAFSTCLGPQP